MARIAHTEAFEAEEAMMIDETTWYSIYMNPNRTTLLGLIKLFARDFVFWAASLVQVDVQIPQEFPPRRGMHVV